MITCHRCGIENDESQKNCVSCLVPLRQRVSVSSSPAAPVSDDPYARGSSNPAPAQTRSYRDSGPPNPHGLPSLICGILGILCCGLLSIPAVILGHKGLKFAREQETEEGRSLAYAGLILGYIGLSIMVGTLLFGLIAALAA
jgi:hypothetical protein